VRGKEYWLIFEKASTPPVLVLKWRPTIKGEPGSLSGPNRHAIGHKESVKDTARVFGAHYDRSVSRFGQIIVEDCEVRGVPAITVLTKRVHPRKRSRGFPDTMQEQCANRCMSGLSCLLAMRQQMGDSLLMVGTKMGNGPSELWHPVPAAASGHSEKPLRRLRGHWRRF